MKNYPVIQLIKVQFLEFIREPGALFWSFVFPFIMALGLGTAFSGKKALVYQVAVVRNDSVNTAFDSLIIKDTKVWKDNLTNLEVISKKVYQEQTGSVEYRFFMTNWDESTKLLKRGIISLILKEDKDKLKYYFDPSSPEGIVVQMRLAGLFEKKVILKNDTSIQPLTQKGTRYIDFLIPGLLAMTVMFSCLWGLSYTLIEKRSKKLLRRMYATPMKKFDFLLAETISRLIITFLEATCLLMLSFWIFDVEIQGSVFAMILLCIAGNFAFIGIAILISSRTSNTQIGNGLINAVTMPMMMLSGIYFSYYTFPQWTIPMIKALPLTIFTDYLRAIFIEGAGFMATLPGILILIIFGSVCFCLGLKIFKWY